MNKEILRLAIPNIISNISVPLLSSVDIALMGRLTELHVGAVGLGGMIFNFIYWNFGFLRMGTTGMTAQAYGQQDKTNSSSIFGRALLVGFILAILILLFQYPLKYAGFYLLNISENQVPLVETYFSIRVWAAPATLALYAFMGWFFGMQNAIYPLILTVAINVLNILISFLLVHQLNWGVAGVAYGTLIAQYFGLLLAIILFFIRYKSYVAHLKRASILLWEELRYFLSINADIFVRTLFLTLAFGFFYSQSSAYGEMMLAVNVILLQFVTWMSYGIDGFAFASESLVGKYAGAKDTANTNKAIRYSFAWGMGLAVVYSLLYGLFGRQLVAVFTDQTAVITATLPFIFWMVLFPLLSTPCYIWDGVFIGLTASRAMRNSMLLAFGFYLSIYFSLGQQWGNHGLWLALLLFMLARGIIQQVLFVRQGTNID